MAEVEYLHLCDSAHRDHDGRVSVLGILSELVITHLPTRARLTLVIQVRHSSADTLPLRVQWLGPSGDLVHVVDRVLDVESDGSAFAVLTLADVPAREDGRHMLRVSSGSRLLLSRAIPVRTTVTAA